MRCLPHPNGVDACRCCLPSVGLCNHEIDCALQLAVRVSGLPTSSTSLGQGRACLPTEVVFIEGLAIFLSVEVFSEGDPLTPRSEESALCECLQVVSVGKRVVGLLFSFTKHGFLHLLDLRLAAGNQPQSHQIELLVGLLSEESKCHDDVT